MDIGGFLEGFLDKLSSNKTGSYLTGSALRKKKRRYKKGRGLVSGDFGPEPLIRANDDENEGMGMYGLGMYGLGMKRKRKNKFDIGKYSRAISRGMTKEEAKRLARK